MSRSIGIYVIRNRYTGKVYVGSSNNIDMRWRLHRSHLRRNKHSSTYLQRAWHTYPETAFDFQIVEECSVESLLTREQYWIDRLQSANPEYGYNLNPVAESSRGRPTSERQREAARKYMLGRRPWNAGMIGMRNAGSFVKGGMSWNKGKKCPQISAANKGRVIAPHIIKAAVEARGARLGYYREVLSSDGSWYHSVTTAAAFAGVCIPTLMKYMREQRPLLGQLWRYR